MTPPESNSISITFVLRGAYAGQTVTLGKKFSFVEGRCTLHGDPTTLALWARSLERNWSAFPENDSRLKESFDVKRDLPANEGRSDGAPSVLSDSEPDGQGAEAGTALAVGEEPAGPEAGEAERGAETLGGSAESLTDEKLKRAVLSLDPNNNAHWVANGKPAMAAVEAAYGSAGITRADVDAAAPGYNRDAARL